MADKPRLLVIDRDSGFDLSTRTTLSATHDVVVARTMARALFLLRDGTFDGVYVAASQLSALRWAGVLLQADEILEAIADGVGVVEPETLRIQWHNLEFGHLVKPDVDPFVGSFYQVVDLIEPPPEHDCPFREAVRTKATADTTLRVSGNRTYRLHVSPTLDPSGQVLSLVALTRDITQEQLQRQKLNAIHEAGEELGDLTPEELALMSVQERTDLLKYNIERHMRDLLGLDFIEIRLLDRDTNRLAPLLTAGMTPLAANRELFASESGNGVTGYVAATGQSYLCRDTNQDPLYLEGAAGARSALTVPLVIHGNVIGTLNVESPKPDAFDEHDQQFLEIYARNIAAALNTLNLLQAEKQSTAEASVEAITRELALPLDDILIDATTALDRYSGHDEDIVNRLRHLLMRVREIRGLIRHAGATVLPKRPTEGTPPLRLANARILVADADESVRRAAHLLLGRQGAIVETARDAHEAIAFARQTPYSVALVDIRLPDLDGYQTYKRLREVQPGVPIILMTGFGYDPTHSIVNARKEGLNTVLYKPFRVDRLTEAVEQAIGSGTPAPTLET